MLTEELKNTTSLAQQELERRLITRVRTIRDPEDYEKLLRLLHGFYSSLEERISRAIDLSKLEDYPLRRKSDLLRTDLEVFTSQPPYFVPAHIELPEITDHLQAMGALYVLESIAPDGKIIVKILKDALGLHTRQGLLFFRGYAEETWQKLETFRHAINTLPLNSADQTRISDAAVATFSQFNLWFDNFEKESAP